MAPPAASWCRRRPARRRWPRRKRFRWPGPPAAATIGAYLASLAESHAPATIRRRLSAIGKMHRFNDLPRNAGHRDIQGPLQGLLRSHGRPARQAAALSLAMLRQLLATCDQSKRGRRDRALLLFGFAGALRRSELTFLRVEDVAVVSGGLRLRIVRGKNDQAGQGGRDRLATGQPARPRKRRAPDRSRHASGCAARHRDAAHWHRCDRRC